MLQGSFRSDVVVTEGCIMFHQARTAYHPGSDNDSHPAAIPHLHQESRCRSPASVLEVNNLDRLQWVGNP